MGNTEEAKTSKVDKSSSTTDQTNVHVYPDWAAIQAYYGPRVPIPSYYNPSVTTSAHHPPPPYMWSPQHMMTPYGAPYAAIYPHGYPHPGIQMGSSHLLQGQKVLASTAIPGMPLSIDTPTKSTGNIDNGLMKKLKEFDGLAMSIGNDHSKNSLEEHKRSRSSETEVSTDGSDGNTTGADEPKLKRSREATPNTRDEKPLVQSSSFQSVSVSPSSENGVKGVIGSIVSPGVSGNSNPFKSQILAIVPPETWLQNERELKRERRKQSNRESARRSRLRKQAETEQLARKVEALTAENMALRSELNQLNDKSQKLKGANATLLDKLKNSESEESAENEKKKVSSNLLTKKKNMDNNESNNSSNKLHQLLDTKPRADAVAAG